MLWITSTECSAFHTIQHILFQLSIEILNLPKQLIKFLVKLRVEIFLNSETCDKSFVINFII